MSKRLLSNLNNTTIEHKVDLDLYVVIR